MHVNERETGERMKMQGAEVVNVDVFKYLGSNIKSKGQHTSEVSNENRQSHWLGVTRMDRIKYIRGIAQVEQLQS